MLGPNIPPSPDRFQTRTAGGHPVMGRPQISEGGVPPVVGDGRGDRRLPDLQLQLNANNRLMRFVLDVDIEAARRLRQCQYAQSQNHEKARIHPNIPFGP